MLNFKCSQGHDIQADEGFAGRKGKCPQCGVGITVPAPMARELTETGAMRILDSADVEHFKASQKAKVTRCPRCDSPMTANSANCENCKIHISLSEHAMVTLRQIESSVS